jgi:hypothetical protein
MWNDFSCDEEQGTIAGSCKEGVKAKITARDL